MQAVVKRVQRNRKAVRLVVVGSGEFDEQLGVWVGGDSQFDGVVGPRAALLDEEPCGLTRRDVRSEGQNVAGWLRVGRRGSQPHRAGLVGLDSQGSRLKERALAKRDVPVPEPLAAAAPLDPEMHRRGWRPDWPRGRSPVAPRARGISTATPAVGQPSGNDPESSDLRVRSSFNQCARKMWAVGRQTPSFRAEERGLYPGRLSGTYPGFFTGV